MNRRRRRPSPALLVACLALFIALGGPAHAKKLLTGDDIANEAVAARHIEAGAIGSRQLRRGAVGSKQLRNRSVRVRDLTRATAAEMKAITPGQVDATALHDGAVTAPKIGRDAVTTPALAAGAVTGPNILDGTIGTADIAENAIRSTKIALAAVRKTHIAAAAVTTDEVRDHSLGAADLAEFTGAGAFPDGAAAVAPGECSGLAQPVTPTPTDAATVLDDILIGGRGAGWPDELVLQVQPVDAATVRVIACNTGKATVPVAGLAFSFIAISG